MDEIKRMMNYSLYTTDIVKFLKKYNIQCKVYTYNQLNKFHDIDKALGKDKCFVLLYMSRPNYGHYITVFKRDKDNIEVYDSYKDMKPDYEFKYIPSEYRQQLGETYPHLTQLLYDSGYKVHYNNHKMQQLSNNISTCGRHVIVRLIKRRMNIDEYYRWVKKICKEYRITPDMLVTIMTSNIKMRN